MKTFIALFFAVSTDAHLAGKSSKGDSMSYTLSEFGGKGAKADNIRYLVDEIASRELHNAEMSYPEFGAKSAKSGGIRYLIDIDELNSRELHDSEMSYRMFAQRPKAFKSDSTKSLSAKALKNNSTKGGKISKAAKNDMSLPLLSAKSSKFMTEGVVHSAEGSMIEGSSRAKALKNNSAKSGKILKSDESDMFFPVLSTKGSKITTQDVVHSTEESKSAKSAILFYRFLDVDMSMSNPIIVAGKSVKLSTKSEKSNNHDATKVEPSKAEKEKATPTREQSSKAAKLSTVRSVDPSDEPSLQYATAIDFTRMSAPAVASATVEETSSSFAIKPCLFTLCVAMALYPLY